MAQAADERIEQLEHMVGEQDARIRELEALIRDRPGGTDRDNSSAERITGTVSTAPASKHVSDSNSYLMAALDPAESVAAQFPCSVLSRC